MESVGTQRTNAQPEVDLGEGSDGNSHGLLILTTQGGPMTEIVHGAAILAYTLRGAVLDYSAMAGAAD